MHYFLKESPTTWMPKETAAPIKKLLRKGSGVWKMTMPVRMTLRSWKTQRVPEDYEHGTLCRSPNVVTSLVYGETKTRAKLIKRYSRRSAVGVALVTEDSDGRVCGQGKSRPAEYSSQFVSHRYQLMRGERWLTRRNGIELTLDDIRIMIHSLQL